MPDPKPKPTTTADLIGIIKPSTGERYYIIIHDHSPASIEGLLQTLDDWADDRELSFTEKDACIVAERARRLRDGG